MAAPKNRYDRAHLANIDVYQRMVTEIYAEASKAAGRLGDRARDGFDPDRPFSFDDFPALRDRVDRLVSSVSSSVTATVMSGISHEWALANSKNDALVRQVFGEDIDKRMTDALRERYFGANEDVLKAFGDRRVAGMNLSQRIWRRTEPFKGEMEDAIDAGLRDGLSAAEISRVIRQYLNHPDMRFRRVQDDHGDLVLSRRAASYHPGAGVYRSSYRNAIRLTGTEVNMAYRTADHERWKDMDMVVGIEIHLSNNHTLNGKPFTDICDSLAGQYPKSFKFTGWHPQCRCYATTILKTEEELAEDDRRILNGEEPASAESSANYVKDVPKEFSDWVKANKERIDAAASGKGTLPYFIRDNQAGVNSIMDGNGWVNAPKPESSAGIPKNLEEIDEALEAIRKVELGGSAGVQDVKAMTEKLASTVDDLKKLNLIETYEVKTLSGKLTTEEIIDRLGGGDMTKGGSCASVALAYAGNRAGLDVLDFRGGESRYRFSVNATLNPIVDELGGKVCLDYNEFNIADALLKGIEMGKEYYFYVGKHASIVRRTVSGFEYLELQHPEKSGNGFKKLDRNALKKRFGCVSTHRISGLKYQVTGGIVDIDLFKNDKYFKELLEFINTPAAKQMKGKYGKIQ